MHPANVAGDTVSCVSGRCAGVSYAGSPVPDLLTMR